MNRLQKAADGIWFQALITGSLSFAHIHDLAEHHGQSGWKAWTYPLSVDLLTVAAYRRLIAAHRAGAPVLLAWVWFLLALAASLAANIIATGSRDVLSIAVGVWPAVAFLGCTLLAHQQTATGEPEQVVDQSPAVEPVAGQSSPVAVNVTVANQVNTTTQHLTQHSETPVAEVPAPLLAWAKQLNATAYPDGGLLSIEQLSRRLGVTPALAGAVHRHLADQITQGTEIPA